MIITAGPIPVFDPDSADARILHAYEWIRAARAFAYSFDDLPDGERPSDEIDAMDDGMIVCEAVVYDTPATTVPGAVAKLLLTIPSLEQSRWVDRLLMEHGFCGLLRHRDRLGRTERSIIDAVDALMRADWAGALAEYEQSAGAFAYVLKGKGLVDEEAFRQRHSGGETQFVRDLDTFIGGAEDRFSNTRQLQRLIRTQTPDQAAYRRKAEIAIAEEYQEEAAVWLVRDANFLLGATAMIEGEAS